MSLKKLRQYFLFCILILSIYYFVLNWSKNINQRKANSEAYVFNQSQKLNDTENKKKYYKVVRIVDGDTVVVRVDYKEEKVRMLGVNTPESVAKNRPDECFGKEASLKTKELLMGKNVFLEFDSAKPERDEYERLLAYVWREDGLFVSEELIKTGFAYEYTYKKEKYEHQEAFKQSEIYAKQNGLGLWSKNTCGGFK